MVLTDKYVKAVKVEPGQPRLEIFDKGGPEGFALRVTANGTKSWVVHYREPRSPGEPIDKPRKKGRKRLGEYPDITLAEARKLASEFLRGISRGQKPELIVLFPDQVLPAESPESETELFSSVADEFLRIWPKRRGLRPKTVTEYTSQLRNRLIPAFGSRPITKITRGEIKAYLDRVAFEEGKAVLSNRLLALMSAVFTFALDLEIVTVNPCFRLPKRTRETPRERVLTDREIRELWALWEHRESSAGKIFQIQLLTACRVGEVKQMRWEQIDWEQNTWTIPGSVSKNHKDHVVPLSRLVRKLLRSLGKKESGWVFEAVPTGKDLSDAAPGHITWLHKSTQRVRNAWRLEKARSLFGPKPSRKQVEQVPELDFNPHDLRRTAATNLAKLGVGRTLVSRLLNHSQDTKRNITGIYDRYEMLPERATALELWASRIETILAGFPSAELSDSYPETRERSENR